jgi:hypothetical protein
MTFAIRGTVGTASACITAVLASAIMTLRSYDAASINPDYYAAVLALPAAGLWLSAIDVRQARGVWWRGLLAGIFFAAAALMKQTGVLGVASLTLVAILAVLFHADYRRWAGVTAMTWLGFLVGVGAAGYVLFRDGTLAIAYDSVIRFNTGLVRSDALRGMIHEWPRISSWCEPVGIALLLGLVGVFADHQNTDRRLSRPVVMVFPVWWGLELVFALLGPSASARYVLGTFPAMSLAAAVGVSLIVGAFAALPTRLRAAPVVLFASVVWLIGGRLFDSYAGGLAQSYVDAIRQPTERDRLGQLGARVRALVPEENDAIYVWNYDSGVYVHAGRPCASAHTHPRAADHVQAILSAIRDGRTKLVLIPGGGSHHFDIWCDAQCIEERGRALEAYVKGDEIDGYTAWVRKGGGATNVSGGGSGR